MRTLCFNVFFFFISEKPEKILNLLLKTLEKYLFIYFCFSFPFCSAVLSTWKNYDKNVENTAYTWRWKRIFLSTGFYFDFSEEFSYSLFWLSIFTVFKLSFASLFWLLLLFSGVILFGKAVYIISTGKEEKTCCEV